MGWANVTYHDLGNAVFGGLRGFTFYFSSAVHAPLITLAPLMVAQGTPLDGLAFIL